ncbi:hypothetical protein SAMN02910456_01234 [Ruminococcaceae bacterium YRB3002]|nr:hypothetical protein SAMN02910456_01234 [Ruminococcaceae bacterium YRB3002]
MAADYIVELDEDTGRAIKASCRTCRLDTISRVGRLKIASSSIKNDRFTTGIRSNLVKITETCAGELGLVNNQIATLVNTDDKISCECTVCVVPDKYVHDESFIPGVIHLSKHLKDNFKSGGECLLLVPQFYSCSAIRPQLAVKIRERNITLGPGLYDTLDKLHPKYIEIRHLATGATLLKPWSVFLKGERIKDKDIRLTYYQRASLNLLNDNPNNEMRIDDKIDRVNYEVSSFFDDYDYDVVADPSRSGKTTLHINDRPKKEGRERLTKVIKVADVVTDTEGNCYRVLSVRQTDKIDEYEVVVDGVFKEKSIRVDKVSDEYNRLQILPVFEDFAPKRTLKDSFLGVIVGDADLCLSAVRPYFVDDERDIVRLSRDNMRLLGIEETDRVKISYKGMTIRATAMEIDSLEMMSQQNILFSEADFDTMVGIPSPLRRQLGVHDVETEVNVVRDTGFIFAKNVNIQLLPILALIFTVFQLSIGIWWQLGICVIMTPVIMFFTLSQERQKVKKIKQTERSRL